MIPIGRREALLAGLAAAALPHLARAQDDLLYGPAQGQTPQYNVAQGGGTLHGRVLTNGTGQDANDLHVNLNTSLAVPQVASFPFPTATAITGNAQFKTRIDLEGATVPNGEIAFVAWESPLFADGVSSANWTSNGNDIGPATDATGLRLVITDAGNGKVLDGTIDGKSVRIRR